MSINPLCPQCHQFEQTARVGVLYVLGVEHKLGHKFKRTESGRPDQPLPRLAQALTPQQLIALSERLAPPKSPRGGGTRPMHPDLVVLVFSLIAPIFLFGIYTSQRPMLLPLLGLLGLAYALYAWQRRNLLAKFAARQAETRQAGERAQKAMARWINLYYCAQDDVVFDPELGVSEDADRLAGFLLRP